MPKKKLPVVLVGYCRRCGKTGLWWERNTFGGWRLLEADHTTLHTCSSKEAAHRLRKRR